jgi:CheY-like chemotaxis protein
MKLIVVADDNEANRELVSVILQRQGYEVMEASNGREALDFVRQRQPDLVLLDIHMPEMDGYETLRVIRDSQRGRTVPIVALTASAMAGDAEEAIEQGFDAYLAKPYEIAAVVVLVKNLIGEAA